jgi:hypothetical protein
MFTLIKLPERHGFRHWTAPPSAKFKVSFVMMCWTFIFHLKNFPLKLLPRVQKCFLGFAGLIFNKKIFSEFPAR